MATYLKDGQNGYITAAVSGVPNALRGERKLRMATWPTRGQRGYILYAASAFYAGGVSTNCHLGQKSTKWQHHPCHFWGPQGSARVEGVTNGYLAGRLTKYVRHPCRPRVPRNCAWEGKYRWLHGR